jgi:hypothetical protein
MRSLICSNLLVVLAIAAAPQICLGCAVKAQSETIGDHSQRRITILVSACAGFRYSMRSLIACNLLVVLAIAKFASDVPCVLSRSSRKLSEIAKNNTLRQLYGLAQVSATSCIV